MTREEHIKWCKERAIAEMNYSGNSNDAIISMMSDLRKHPETNSNTLQMLCMFQIMGNQLSREKIIEFINGFN